MVPLEMELSSGVVSSESQNNGPVFKMKLVNMNNVILMRTVIHSFTVVRYHCRRFPLALKFVIKPENCIQDSQRHEEIDYLHGTEITK